MTDGADVASPLLSDGTAVYTPGISERTGSTTTYYHMDAPGTGPYGQGSVVATTNGSQTQTGDMRYDAFGTKTYYVNSVTTFGWNAKSQYRTDIESGLMLLGHRYYDSATGRFISQDPDQDGWNWYAYCGNNPLGGVDPTGLRKPKDGPPPDETPKDKANPKGPPKSYEPGVKDGQRGTWKTFKDGTREFEPDPEPTPKQDKGHPPGQRNQGAKGEGEHSVNEKGNPLPPGQRGNQGQGKIQRAVAETAKVSGWVIAGVILYEGAKWTAATLLAPETCGGSWAIAAATP